MAESTVAELHEAVASLCIDITQKSSGFTNVQVRQTHHFATPRKGAGTVPSALLWDCNTIGVFAAWMFWY